MIITESLTKRRVVELKKTREMYDFRNVWSHDDKILFLDVNDRNKLMEFYDWSSNPKAQSRCLFKGEDYVCFVFFIITLFEFWGFCTV